MEEKNFRTVNRYRGSRDGWKYKDFHRTSDGIKPSISLFKTKKGKLIGGFTSAQWTPDREYATDSTAFLFNLSTNHKFSIQDPTHAIYGADYRGPRFGDNAELAAISEPFNGENKCWSWVNYSVYKIPYDSDGKTSMLTNEECRDWGLCEFTIVELEVWEVVFEE